MRIGKDAGPKSSSEIREKVEQMKAKRLAESLPKGPQVVQRPAFATGDAEKALAEKKANPIAAKTALPEAATADIKSKSSAKEDITLKSDIGINDPKDEVTQEKLKGLLTTGGFNFSDKERKALSSILGMNK